MLQVRYHLSRDFQPDVRTVHHVTWGSSDVHDQLDVTLQFEPSLLFQIRWPRHR